MKKFTFIGINYQPKQLKLVGGKISTFAVIKNEDLSYQDFSDRVLNNIIFVNCNLQGSSFERILSENIKFYGCNLSDASFKYSVLLSPTFSKCTGKISYFNCANLIDPIFYHSNFSNSVFLNTTIENLRGQYVNFSGIDFTTSTISGTFVLIGNFKDTEAKASAGFRTKKGGEQNYQVPVCTKKCKDDPTFCRQSCDCNTHPLKFSKNIK